MTHKGINFLKLLKGYKKGWVAISSRFDRVVFHGKTLKETMKKAARSKEKVFFFPAGEKYSNLIT